MPRVRWFFLAITVFALAAAAAETPPPAGAGRYGGHVLAYGSRNSDFAAEYVGILQADLYKLGYAYWLDKDGHEPGVFDLGTENAVKAFQKDYGLKATGVVDLITGDMVVAALAGAPPVTQGGKPVLTELASFEVVAKTGKGTASVKVNPEKDKTYVYTAEGEVNEVRVITPYGAEAKVKKPPADVRAILKDQCGDPDVAVIFDGANLPGDYKVEVVALNDLKDIPVKICLYELTREGDAGTP